MAICGCDKVDGGCRCSALVKIFFSFEPKAELRSRMTSAISRLFWEPARDVSVAVRLRTLGRSNVIT